MKALNLKNMKETLVNYSGCNSELDKIWDTFYHLATLGFIDAKTWREFYDQCAGWYVDEENQRVMDGRNLVDDEEPVVWVYTADAQYKA